MSSMDEQAQVPTGTEHPAVHIGENGIQGSLTALLTALLVEERMHS